jgi:hypothetical protein
VKQAGRRSPGRGQLDHHGGLACHRVAHAYALCVDAALVREVIAETFRSRPGQLLAA